MNTQAKRAERDKRTEAQKQADEELAGQWNGPAVESLLTEDGALQIIEHCRNLAKEGAMSQTTAMESIRNQPFRWKDKVFRIIRCDYIGGQAQVEVVPHDADFVAEIKRRVEGDRFHTLTYYQGFGFICFPEDYQHYQS